MNINPELVEAAAEIAFPGVDMRQGHPTHALSFNPLEDDSDAFALERALKDECNGRWAFSKSIGNTLFMASSRDGATKGAVLTDKSDTLLLLKCVSAMTNLPMSTGGGE